MSFPPLGFEFVAPLSGVTYVIAISAPNCPKNHRSVALIKKRDLGVSE
jgi:hypothetical protein